MSHGPYLLPLPPCAPDCGCRGRDAGDSVSPRGAGSSYPTSESGPPIPASPPRILSRLFVPRTPRADKYRASIPHFQTLKDDQ